MNTKHFNDRSKQRGLPPFVDQLLDLYGQEQYDGHGGVVIFLDKKSIRAMEKDMGREPVRKFAEWHKAYKVKSTTDGAAITIGHRLSRVWRK